MLDLAQREKKQAWLVMNRTRAGTRLGTDVARAAGGMSAGVMVAELANRVVYAESLGQGRGALEAPRGLAGAEVSALADEILRLL